MIVDCCIFYHDKDIHKNKEFSTLDEWFVENKLPIHLGEDKRKCLFFSKPKGSLKLDTTYRNHKIKQCHTVEFLVSP